ncbi:hypothetical protein KP509_01G068800 [Ceratopteris richardii]|uniref:Apolipoprotein L3-like n=1 Tax=Ceratopteris richardii TaxID=49495 RepID=A0A8T2VKP0_CERRI|nr:hypothetical protein KP509_01G068800 [Ceratopteris richardii]
MATRLVRQQEWKLESMGLLKGLNWEREMEDLAIFMENVAHEMSEVDKNVAISSVTGSSVAMAGGVMVAAGIIGSIFTFGALAPLAIAGAVASGAGGLTSSGSQYAKQIILRDRIMEAKVKLESHNPLFRSTKKILEGLKSELDILSCKKMGQAEDSSRKIMDIVLHINRFLPSVTEITAALGHVLSATASVQTGMENLAAVGCGVAVNICDVMRESEVLQRGGNSGDSFRRIARSIREIKDAMLDELAKLENK